MKSVWWRDSIVFFSKASAWIAGPILLALVVSHYVEKKWTVSPWVFFGIIGLAFILSCVGIVREGLGYIKNAEREVQDKKLKDQEHEKNS